MAGFRFVTETERMRSHYHRLVLRVGAGAFVFGLVVGWSSR